MINSLFIKALKRNILHGDTNKAVRPMKKKLSKQIIAPK